MPDKGRCGDDSHGQQPVEVLGLEHHEDKEAKVECDKGFVDHAGAYLVLVAVEGKVYGSKQGQQQYEDACYDTMFIEQGKIEGWPELYEFGEVPFEEADVAPVDIVGTHKPVGGCNAQDGGKEGAGTECQDTGGQKYPEYRYEKQRLHEGYAGYADEEESIEHPSRSRLVLVGFKEIEVEPNEGHLCYIYFYRR